MFRLRPPLCPVQENPGRVSLAYYFAFTLPDNNFGPAHCKGNSFMNHYPMLSKILGSLERLNVQELKDRAFLANKISKMGTLESRKAAYEAKDAVISELIRRGAARLISISLWPEMIASVQFVDGGMLHAVVAKLKWEAQQVVFDQMLTLFAKGTSDQASSMPKASRQRQGEFV